MKTPVYLSVLAVALLTGCGNDSSKPAQGTNSNAVRPGNPAADYGNALVNSRNLAIKTVDLTSLNKAVQLFNEEEGRNPKDLDELVQTRHIARLPDPPPGMKFAYDPTTGVVTLVSQ